VAAIGDFLVFLDDDCVPKHDNYFSKLIEIHEQNPHATAVGGFYLAAENAGMLTNAYIEISRSWLEGSMYREGNSFNLLGGNVSYRKENLGTIYRFNSHIRFGGAETEFHSRLVKAGHEFVLSNDIPVIHYASLSFMGFVYRAYMQGYRWLEIKEAGMAPSFRVSPKKSRPMNRPLKLIFSFFFRLGEDWARIKLYEDTFIRQCFELIRLRFMRTVEILRSSKMLREFCHFSLYLAQERRRLRLKKIEDEFSR
jgi:GT2 family glycosyltransferase